MKITCISCGYEINLDHRVFDDYTGPVKCYSCSAMMEITTAQGLLRSSVLLRPYPPRTACDQVDARLL
jgi:hypothetical protein